MALPGLASLKSKDPSNENLESEEPSHDVNENGGLNSSSSGLTLDLEQKLSSSSVKAIYERSMSNLSGISESNISDSPLMRSSCEYIWITPKTLGQFLLYVNPTLVSVKDSHGHCSKDMASSSPSEIDTELEEIFEAKPPIMLDSLIVKTAELERDTKSHGIEPYWVLRWKAGDKGIQKPIRERNPRNQITSTLGECLGFPNQGRRFKFFKLRFLRWIFPTCIPERMDSNRLPIPKHLIPTRNTCPTSLPPPIMIPVLTRRDIPWFLGIQPPQGHQQLLNHCEKVRKHQQFSEFHWKARQQFQILFPVNSVEGIPALNNDSPVMTSKEEITNLIQSLQID